MVECSGKSQFKYEFATALTSSPLFFIEEIDQNLVSLAPKSRKFREV